MTVALGTNCHDHLTNGGLLCHAKEKAMEKAAKKVDAGGNKCNCRVRLKSFKDGRITAIHHALENRVKNCNDVLKRNKGDFQDIIIFGFTPDGEFIFDTSGMSYSTESHLLRNLIRQLNLSNAK